MGLALVQHYGEIALGSTFCIKTFFPAIARPAPKLKTVKLLPTPPFWFATLITLGFAIFVGSSFFIDLAVCGATGGYAIGMKKALVITPAPPSKVFN